ncbi:Glyco_transf_92 domain-containing protein [Cephalotus follicularis]|uniref:Glycosyltransferase family 92 protein n=1 Tax=Cephalotus follicularis TaxID=3775 RepID=A0A1Q3D152_CEPFO|nr:Glyco_transf_92 domain-containing protein [Cephalotus follicularis]
MDSEQRRKRKRTYRPYSRAQYLSVRSLILCLCFLVFLLFISSDRTVSIRPVLSVSRLSLLSSNSLQVPFRDKSSSLPLRIEGRVLFPDHLLLLASDGIHQNEKLYCVYYRVSHNIPIEDGKYQDVAIKPVLFLEGYDEYRLVVRCPLPSLNYSASVDLRRSHVHVRDYDWSLKMKTNQTVHSWEKVVYEAAVDGNTAVVFAKGLNLRPHKESDATHFRCRFGLGNWDKDNRFVVSTRAVTAAQEVVRCLFPRSLRKNPNKTLGIRVTLVHDTVNSNSKALVDRVVMPSVARIYNSKAYEQRRRNQRKYELCACTMLWNQASSLKEWIMYHAWLGVERWFIYDNNSDDGIQEVIEELELQNYNVSRHNWPWIKTQEAGFSHCALRARDQCKWVGFFDVDEFFYFPRDHERGLVGQNSLKSLVANYTYSKRIAEIRTACHSFGPSGLSSHPEQGVTVGYTCRLQSPERHKSIVRPDLLAM